MKRYWSAAFALLLIVPASGRAQTSTLNLSRDLVRLGISSSDLVPNQPSLDAGPLLLQGFNYARTNRISLVTVDPGAYYFLSLQFPGFHVVLTRANNMTIDFQGSDLFLARTQRIGIALTDSTNTVLKNFTMDFIQLPFTQLSVTSVDPAQRQIQFQVPAGWQHPSVFNTPQTTSGVEEEDWVFIFRNGQPVQGIGRLNDSLANPVVTMTDADGTILPVSIAARTLNVLTVQLPAGSALGGAVINVTSGSTVLRGTLFVDSEDNFPLLSRSWSSVPITLNGAGVTSTAGNPNTLKAGYATVSVNTGSTPYATAVFSSSSNNIVVSEAAVPASPPTTLARIFIDYRSGAFSTNTGVALVNPGATAASVTYTLRSTAGSVLSTGHGSIAAGAHVAKFINQLKDVAPDFAISDSFQTQNKFGSLDIVSNQPLSIAALRLTANQRGDSLLTTTPTADLTRPLDQATRYFPHFVDGGGYTTTFVLLNTSTATETGKLNVHNDAGVRDSSFSYSIAPGGVFVFESSGSAVQTTVGSAQVVPDANTFTPTGAGVFSYSQGGVIVTESGIPSATLTSHALIYIDMSAGHNTGIALAATGASGPVLTLKAFQKDGRAAGTSLGPVTLTANGHKAAFIDQFVSGLPAGFTGVPDISSSTPFAALTLRSLINARGDFLLTTLPIADANVDAPSSIIFSQIVDGGGYSTQFILLSPRGTSSPSLYFYDDTGAPLVLGR